MKKFGSMLTILIVLSGCSAARPVMRTEEKPVKSVTSIVSDAQALERSSTGDPAKSRSDATDHAGLIAVSTTADQTGAEPSKADPIKNAADKTVGSSNGVEGSGAQPTQGTTQPAQTNPPMIKVPDITSPQTAPGDTSNTQSIDPNALAPKKVSKYNLFDYYPLIANRQVDLVGPAGDSSLILQYLYEESGKATAQLKQFNGDTSQLNVISITEDQITELYYSQDINYRENIIGLKNYVQRVILKAPLVLGNQWNSTGLQFEITAVDESRVINKQTRTVLDVTVSTGTEKILFTYAVGVGLVSNDVINPDGSLTNIVQLAQITDAAQDIYSVDFYFPSKAKEVYLITQDVSFNTNDATKDKLTAVYKEIAKKQNYDPVIGEKTQIQFIFSRDNIVHMDLNNAFIDFINATPALENQRLESLVDTICSFYKADGLILTINNQRYESVSRKIETTEVLKPLYKATTP